MIFFNDVAVVVPRHEVAVAEFRKLGTQGNSQPSGRAKKHLMMYQSESPFL